jgi:hypothetical protein
MRHLNLNHSIFSFSISFHCCADRPLAECHPRRGSELSPAWHARARMEVLHALSLTRTHVRSLALTPSPSLPPPAPPPHFLARFSQPQPASRDIELEAGPATSDHAEHSAETAAGIAIRIDPAEPAQDADSSKRRCSREDFVQIGSAFGVGLRAKPSVVVY